MSEFKQILEIELEYTLVKEAYARFQENENKQIASGKKWDREASLAAANKYGVQLKEFQKRMSRL